MILEWELHVERSYDHCLRPLQSLYSRPSLCSSPVVPLRNAVHWAEFTDDTGPAGERICLTLQGP